MKCSMILAAAAAVAPMAMADEAECTVATAAYGVEVGIQMGGGAPGPIAQRKRRFAPPHFKRRSTNYTRNAAASKSQGLNGTT